MNRYRFDLATDEDDDELRRVLSQTPMEGDLAISFRREPSFFDAEAVHGPFRQTVVGRDGTAGRIVGFGGRSVRDMFVNGVREPIGYLSGLRVLPGYRNLGLVARGYAHFRTLHGDGRTRLYLTAIAEGNDRAVSILTSGRAGLPPYHFAGRYVTAAIPVPPRPRRHAASNVRPATTNDLPDLLAFWSSEGPRRQFFPRYDRDDFFTPTGTFRDLRPEEISVAFQDGRIVGTLAAWDQRPFRQSVVERYSARLRRLRPAYDILARLRGRSPLPELGMPIPCVAAALPVVAGDDPSVFTALLRHVLERLSGRLRGHLLVGMHERDPLRPTIRRFRPTEYMTRLYHVCWSDGEALRGRIDNRTPYLELGTL